MAKNSLLDQVNYPSDLRKLKEKLDQQIKKYGIKASDLLESIEFILTREF